MAQQPRTINIHPPLGGVQHKFGFQNQGPYTSILSMNMWPIDSANGRSVSATRPPLEAFDSPGADVNMLVQVNGDGSQIPQVTFLAARNGLLYKWTGSGMEQIDTSFSPPAISTGRPVVATPYLEQVFIANTGAPLYYDHSTQSVPAQRLNTLVADAGDEADIFDARICATWQGAVWWAGQPASPHLLYGSRVGDPLDYDFSVLAEDEGGAFATLGENEGLINEPITALMPQTTDTMIVGCVNSMWALRGHPRRNGSFESVSETVGPLGQGAWCKAPDDTLYILTKTGLMTLSPEPNSIAQEISRERIPDKLIALDFVSTNPVINMEFDTRYNGVIICVRGEQRQAWFYDIKNGGFHELEFDDGDEDAEQYPTVLLNFPELATETTSGVLFGGEANGGIARFDNNGTEEVPYSIFIGPIKISPNAALKSMVTNVRIILGLESTLDGTCTVWFGTDGEEAYINATTPREEFGFSTTLQDLAYNNGIMRPRQSNHAMLLELSGNDKVIFESADADFIPSGMQRRVRNWSSTPQVNAGPDQAVLYT